MYQHNPLSVFKHCFGAYFQHSTYYCIVEMENGSKDFHTAVFLVSSGGQCGNKQNKLVLYEFLGYNLCNLWDQKLHLECGNDLWTAQVRRTNTLAWCTKSVGSDHKYWPPLETAVICCLVPVSGPNLALFKSLLLALTNSSGTHYVQHNIFHQYSKL